VDSSSLEQMSLLIYNSYGRHFEFEKMKQGRVVFHTNRNYIDQVCGDYLISFKNDFSKAYIENDYLLNISTPFRKAMPLKLPKMRLTVDYFTLHKCPGSSILLVVITPSFDDRLTHPEPQYLFTINTETFEVKPVVCPYLPIRNIVPTAGDRYFC
jgi:hypothetical protein